MGKHTCKIACHYKYEFTGYTNDYLFVQEIDTTNRRQIYYVNILIDRLFLIDSISDETRFMIAKPFGKIQPDIECLQKTIDSDTTFLINRSGDSEFGEKIYSGNILKMDINTKGIITATYIRV